MRWIIRLESICFLFLIVNSFAYAQDGSITDRRDGKTYKTVKIGAQTWMAENLAYETGDSWCYDNRESNCLKMGRIYPESNLRYICPEKWKLPSKEDVETLINGVGRNEVKYLLNAYYGGLAGAGDGEEGVWFTSDISFVTSTTDYNNPYGRMPYVLSIDGNKAYVQSLNGNIIGYSVRCILNDSESGGVLKLLISQTKDASEAAYDLMKNEKFSKDIDRVLKDVAGLQTTGKTVLGRRQEQGDGANQYKKVKNDANMVEKTDYTILENNNEFYVIDFRDGNKYKIAKILGRIWMTENLNFQEENSFCYENERKNCSVYGRLYMWDAAIKSCPKGWHLPSKEEMNGISDLQVNELKSSKGWCDDRNGEDLFMFSAIPAGLRDEKALYYDNGYSANFWSSTEGYSGFACGLHIKYDRDDVLLSVDDKNSAYSVRCVLDDDAIVKHGVPKKLLGENKNSVGIGDGLAGLFGGEGGVATKAKGQIKTPTADEVDIVSVSRSASDVMKVVRQRTPGLRHIYNKFLKKKPGFQGKVALKFMIAPGGEIISISIAYSTTNYGDFDDEIKSAVSRWKFNKFSLVIQL